MSDSKDLFFMRDAWAYDPEEKPPARQDARQGFDTRALHAGWHPLTDLELSLIHI